MLLRQANESGKAGNTLRCRHRAQAQQQLGRCQCIPRCCVASDDVDVEFGQPVIEAAFPAAVAFRDQRGRQLRQIEPMPQ